MNQTSAETPLGPGETAGLENDKYHWRVSVSPFQFRANNLDVTAIAAELFKIRVVVSWGDNTGADTDDRQVELITLKLVNKVL